MSSESWYKNNRVITGIAIVTILVIVGITLFLIIKKPSSSKDTAQLDSATSSKSDISRTPVSTTANAKTLALQRLGQITGGVGIDDLQKLQSTEIGSKPLESKLVFTQTPLASSIITPTNPISTTARSTTNLSSTYAQQLAQEKNITDDLVIYNETESYSVPYPDQDPTYISIQGDEKNPIITKTWYSVNYFKNASYKGDKLISLYINTPNYSLSYYGGKYAIKDIYTSSNYFGGVIYGSNGIQNQELEFLKQILRNPNLKKLPTIQKDGKDLDVYEETQTQVMYPQSEGSKVVSNSSQESVSSNLNSSQPQNNYSTKYYVDKNNFVLYLIENFTDGKLQYSSKTLKSQELKSPDFSQTFDAKPEIGQAPIKEFKSQEYYDKSSNLSNFSEKYGLISVKQLGTKNVSVSDSQIPEIIEYDKARNSVDFEPNFNSGISVQQDSQNYTRPVASIYQQKANSSINFSFYNKLPDNNLIYFNGYNENNKKTIKINLDGKKIDAQYIDQSFEQSYSATITFQYGKYWVVGSVNDYSSVLYNSFSSSTSSKQVVSNLESLITSYEYVTLSKASAKEIDDYRMAKSKSSPAIESTNLDKIEASKRLLPGNLEPKYKVTLSSVVKSTKKPTESTCYNYLEHYYELESCLMEKFDGYGLGFTNTELYSQNPASNGYSSINFTVLDTPITSINILDIKTKLADDSSELELKPIDNGLQINVAGDPYNSGYILAMNDKTVLVSYYTINVDSVPDSQKNYIFVKDLVGGLSTNKDFDILKSQLPKVNNG